MNVYTTFGVIAGLLLINSGLLSCTPEQDIQSPMDVFLNDEFIIYTAVDSIPKALVDAVSDHATIAEPGNDFNETDTVADMSLPFRRLIFAGRSDNHWFIYFEEGGIARNHQVALFEFSDEQINQKTGLTFTFTTMPTDLEGLRHMVVSARQLMVIY